jgi:hypothetical protein
MKKTAAVFSNNGICYQQSGARFGTRGYLGHPEKLISLYKEKK